MTSNSQRTREAANIAEPYDGVMSRRMLRRVGADRNVVARQVAASRWRVLGRETIATHTGTLSDTALAWRALWEVRCARAAIDGVSALRQAGLTGFDTGAVDVSVPWETRIAPVPGVRIHRVCREAGDVTGAGLPRVRAPLATVRAAHWASTDRQAALLLVLPLQQRLIRPADLAEAMARERVRGRRAVVRQLVADIVDGAHSLGELDFARLCRQRGLPEPDRQAMVRTPNGRVYLDVRWTDIGLVVEIDGAGHRAALSVMADNFRQNRVTLEETMVLRFDLLALRLQPNEVLDQVCDAFAACARRPAR